MTRGPPRSVEIGQKSRNLDRLRISTMRNDLAVVTHIRSLLQQYGWETGLKKLQAEIEAADDPGLRDNLRFFAGWMAAERGASEEADEHFDQSLQVEALQGWALFGQAFLALRRHENP